MRQLNHIRWLVAVVVLVTSVFGMHGIDHEKAIFLSFPANSFRFDTINGLTSVYAPDLTYRHDTDTLMPKLPKIAVNVLIPSDEEVHEVTFKYSNPASWSQVTLEACQLPMPTDSDYYYLSHPAVSSTTPSVTYMGDAKVRGFKMSLFEVSPFSYNVSTGTLTAFQNITLLIRLGTSQGLGNLQPPLNSTSWACDTAREWLKDMVCNYAEVGTLYPNLNNDTLPGNKRFQYLIITNNSLKPVFQRLSDWKNMKGVRTKIITTEEIYQNYSAATPQQQIKSAIMALRDSTWGALKYVLLGGDQTIVPIQKCYVKCLGLLSGVPTLYAADTPSDLYYASLKELDWDYNGNGLAGEVSDSVSLSPDVIVTRIPVSESTSANSVINKILRYEKTPDEKPWKGSFLLAGNLIEKYYAIDSMLVSDAQLESEEMYNQYIVPHWQGTMTRFFDTYTDLPGGASYDLIIQNLHSELAKGYTFLHMDCHGSPRTWNMEYDSAGYRIQHAGQLNNDGHTIIITTACHTCAFDSVTQCLAEAFLHNPNSGVNTYVGSSRQGWSSSCEFDGLLLRQLLKRNATGIAEATYMAKTHKLPSCYSNSTARWLCMSINVLGDAEMPVFTREPKRFSDISLYLNNGHLLVNTFIDSCRTCVMSLDDAGQTYYTVKNDVTSVCNNFDGLVSTSPYSVCITKDRYVPFVADVLNQFYLQNETIGIPEERHIVTEKAFVGSDVTSQEPFGAVLINGKMTIHSSGGILLDKGTTISKGAEFKIFLSN